MAKTQRKPGKHAGGRPTKYRPEMRQTVEAAAGTHAPLTDEQIAELFGVTPSTVANWYHQFPEFLESVKKAKAVSDDKVERSLFERATGYSVPDVHISNYQGDVTVTPIIKHYPPDPVAMIFWLKNRRPQEWRDKHDVEHSGNLTVERVDYSNADCGQYNPDGSKRSQDAAPV